jgi:hypothetical protein
MNINKVSYLDTVFVIGKVNGDHWCLYLATPLVVDTDGNAFRAREVDESIGEDEDDVTLEILMQELDPHAMKAFWRTEKEIELGKAPHNVGARKHDLPRRIYVIEALNIEGNQNKRNLSRGIIRRLRL